MPFPSGSSKPARGFLSLERMSQVAENFADRLVAAIRQKRTPACVGIDPVYQRLPAQIAEYREFNDESDSEAALDAVLEYCRRVIRLVAPLVPAVKINSAYFERYYWEGMEGYFGLIQEAADLGLVVIGDCKRADVGHTAEMYARSSLADPDFVDLEGYRGPDAVTVNPYLGYDGVRPFIDVARAQNKGVFVLVRTSNESASQVQGFTSGDGLTLADHVARLVGLWSADDGLVGRSGYSCVGAVVAPRDRESALRLRALMSQSLLLVPGFGAQGITADLVAPCFKSDGSGALISASRCVIYAYENARYVELYPSDWEKCVQAACKDFVTELAGVVSVS